MKKIIRKIIYIIIVLLSLFFWIVFLKWWLFLGGLFFILIPTGTIGYFFYVNSISDERLSPLLLFYGIFWCFVLWYDIWSDFMNEPLQEPREKKEFFIPEEWHYLYPKNGFSDLAILKDDFDNIKYDYQENLSFKENTFQIYDGFQWWIYSYEAWLNIPVSWEIYLKAYDLLTDIELSADRLKKVSTLQVSNTLWEIKLFSLLESEGRGKFSIYEWDWWEYYWARFELWYAPFNGWAQKLLEDYYIIDWWMR